MTVIQSYVCHIAIEDTIYRLGISTNIMCVVIAISSES